MKSKSKIVGFIYQHTELCYTCGKEGQWHNQDVYIGESPKVSFCKSGIPVKWVSSYDGVYCSEECHAQSIIAKEKEND